MNATGIRARRNVSVRYHIKDLDVIGWRKARAIITVAERSDLLVLLELGTRHPGCFIDLDEVVWL